MNKMQCYGCINTHLDQFKQNNSSDPQNQSEQQLIKSNNIENIGQKSNTKVTFKIQGDEDKQQQQQISIYFICQCCNNNYCLKCCKMHLKKLEEIQIKKQINQQNKDELQGIRNIRKNIKIICQQCQTNKSNKYCQNCQQFLCQKCSFKIHNKGKRAKHILDQKLQKYIYKNEMILLNKDIIDEIRQFYKNDKQLNENLLEYIKQQLKINIQYCIILLENQLQKYCQNIDQQIYIKYYNSQQIKYHQLLIYRQLYPFIQKCKIIIVGKNNHLQNKFIDYIDQKKNKIKIQIVDQYSKKIRINHQRVNSQKLQTKHIKNFSNFSNLSNIQKIQNQSILSGVQSDLFESNQLNLNITLNQNSSILMMGALSDRQKEQKDEKKYDNNNNNNNKQIDRLSGVGQHIIYSIRQQNSHNQINNLSTSTDNSIRKRNRKWPIPYFQPFRVPKYIDVAKNNAQVYLRQLAQKGILMIRRQKAEDFIQDPSISRNFIRNIGARQIQYVSYILDFLSIQSLSWVIQSIKQDKMTPNEKLIQSRLKQSFQLKINMKLWDSIIKYLQSPQYDQDYLENTKVRYVPKITVVKYGEQYLLEFQERKWAYQDQELLDQQQEQWQQFKKLISNYFNDKSQITGGRYGCVQYVKLNGPKPLRKCSLGKLSMYVQQAINKGIIRYQKTLLVSNSQQNSSMYSNLNGETNGQQLVQLQRDIKIMALQVALIDMFLQYPTKTLISMAQIPLNLKTKLLFDYNLVELGFPKLKNLINTLNDKLIIQTTKTHTSYQTTTNGSQIIQKLRNKLAQSNQRYLGNILTYLNLIMSHYQSLRLQDLYNQLTLKIGYQFDYKIYNVPDFYQFILYYCSQIMNVQFIQGIFLVFIKYLPVPYQNQNHQHQIHATHTTHQTHTTHTTHQTHRTTYSQDQYQYNKTPNQTFLTEDNYSRKIHKKYSQFNNEQKNYLKLDSQFLINQQLQPYGYSTFGTPKFSTNKQRKKIDKKLQQINEDQLKIQDKIQQQNYDFDDKIMQQNINNILDDQKSVSHPKTVIQNDCSQRDPNQLYLYKNQAVLDQNDSFFGTWCDAPKNNNKTGKMQHQRVKSTNHPGYKHYRVKSTSQDRN